MDKRYQVFVSSTYTDLQEARQLVTQTLMEMDCIPAGMELFPAVDEEQWEFIKKIIDDCDYYLLIIGGRYGSVTSEGISYTEKEFDYALKKGMKIVALIHGSPADLPFKDSEGDPELRKKLENFKEKAKNGRLVKFWKETKELPGLVSLSMSKTIKMFPEIGWVRANKVANEFLLVELNDLRKENQLLQKSVTELTRQLEPNVEGIEDIDSIFDIHGTYKIGDKISYSSKSSVAISWREVFKFISPYLIEYPNEVFVKSILETCIKKREKYGSDGYFIIDEQDLKTISIQLQAYGLIQISCNKTRGGDLGVFWSITDKGKRFMIECRIVRKNEALV